MLSEELKNLVSHIGAVVVADGNQPKFVVLSYERLKDILIHKNIDNYENPGNDNEEILERLNNEILILKAEVAEKEKELSDNNL